MFTISWVNRPLTLDTQYTSTPPSLAPTSCPSLHPSPPPHTLVLELVQVHEFAGFGVESHGHLPLRLPPLLLLLLTGSPRHLLLQLVQLTAPWAWTCAETDEIIGQSGEAGYSRVSKFKCVHGYVPALVPPPQLGEGSSCRMAPLLFDLGTERHEGPDISTRFCCPTSLWRQRERRQRERECGEKMLRVRIIQLQTNMSTHWFVVLLLENSPFLMSCSYFMPVKWNWAEKQEWQRSHGRDGQWTTQTERKRQ